MARLHLQSPWQRYYDELEVFFEEDPEVRLIFDDDSMEVKIYVSDKLKAEALELLIPAEHDYGTVTLKTTIVPPNSIDGLEGASTKECMVCAFKNNPIVEEIRAVTGVLSNDIVYVIFRKEVVQYYNDDMGDAYGNCSTLYQDVAKRLFDSIPGVFFCTSVEYNYDVESVPVWP